MKTRFIDNHTAFTFAKDQLLAGQSVELRVCGQSMLPFFRSGSRIVLRPIQEQDFQLGQVVMAESQPGKFVVHRIYRIAGDQITLLGDGNVVGMETMPRSKVYGVVDCSRLHRTLARLWQRIRPWRRYPLAILRRLCAK